MYHHFKGTGLSRSEKIQRLVVERILASRIPDSKRENSRIWELKHSSSCIQLSRLLAEKRGLNVELAEVIAALHDIYAIETGKYKGHAKNGAAIAKKILAESREFSETEVGVIAAAIANHSSKEVFSRKPYDELIKDADTLDCFFYVAGDPAIYDFKPPEVKKAYFKRVVKVRRELGLPVKAYMKKIAGVCK